MNLIIDGSSLLWRSHHVNVAKNTSSPELDCYMFLKSLKSYVNLFNSDVVYIAWDKRLCSERGNFRFDINPEYKGNRDKDTAANVYMSQEIIHKMTESLGCLNMYPGVMEADDVIAWLVHNLHGNNVVVTSDKDMLQLISDTTIVYHPSKKLIIDKNNFIDEVGVSIDLYLPYKAIIGDSSDNIKGVSGYGKVRAKKLAEDYINSEIKDSQIIDTINQNIQIMDLSKGYLLAGSKETELYSEQLLKKDVLSCNINDFSKYCKENKFESFLKEIGSWEGSFGESPLFKLLKNSKFNK